MSENTENQSNNWKYISFVLIAVVLVGAFIVFNNNKETTGSVVDNKAVGVGNSAVKVSIDDDAMIGDPNAPVTIIEFSDYQCPFCARFYTQTYPLLKEQYIDTGKANLVFRDFPLANIHPEAFAASEAAECVREQGGDEAYFEMHDKIFENQNSLSKTSLNNFAKELGYDIEACLSSGKFYNEVNQDLQDGTTAGVRGTPSFFINGKMLEGAQPFSEFQRIIDQELS
jgi:protein-disulfide isomerase